MKSNGIFHSIGQGFRYFWSNKVMSLASIIVLAACLFIMSCFALVSLNLNMLIKDMEDKNEIVAFIDEAYDADAISALEAKLNEIPNISEIVYVSKEQALEEFKQSANDYSAIFDIVDDNPLRNSFKIKFEDLELFDTTLQQVKDTEGIANIRSRADIVDKITSIADIVGNISFWVMLLLFASSLFIIVNTIKLARFTYRKQINIMKYVGATNWFIRWPFIFEGGIIGCFAGAVSFFLTWYAYYALFERMMQSSLMIQLIPFTTLVDKTAILLVAGGALIGIIGSAIAIRRYLDV